MTFLQAMLKKSKLCGNLYMVITMTFCASLYTCLTGHATNFFAFWGQSFLVGFPLAVFFSTFVVRVGLKGEELLHKLTDRDPLKEASDKL